MKKEEAFHKNSYLTGRVPHKESCLVGWFVTYNHKLNFNSLVLHDINASRQ